jgi:diguanylate cyclase (GGDEF)-like protein
VQFDCTLNPLPDGRILFIAEMSVYDHSLPDKYNHLLKLVTQLKVDYDQVKKILIAKQTEIDAVVAQAKEVSHIDPLTYLPNRRQIINDLQHETLRSERYKTPLSISMMDIDHFKEINDTFGHQVGDEVLRSIAMHLREHIRLPDIVGRYGGEEFLILLPNSLMEAAAEQAERLCRQINETEINASGRTFRMTVSIGIAQYHIGAESWQKLLNRADAALYRAKNNGRNTWAAADE